jgi:branched-chain amino acid transport system substrate-binding protein
MKKVLYLGTLLAFVVPLAITGRTSLAAHQSAPMIKVRLCTDGPAGVGGDAHLVQGMYHGVTTAVATMRGKFKKAGLDLLPPLNLDDAKSDGSAVDPAKEASNSHQCADNPADVGYIGTLNSSMEQVAEPILNKAGMANLSPSNTNPILTSPTNRSTYEPLTASGKLKYPTYYRSVTTDAVQGYVGALYMSKVLGIKKYFLVDDQQTYGAGLARVMDSWGGKLGMTNVGSAHLDTSSTSATATSAASAARIAVSKSPQAIYCGCDAPYAGPMLAAARRAGYKGLYLGGDAITSSSFLTFAGGAANLYSSYASTVGNLSSSALHTPAYLAFVKQEHRFYKGWVTDPYDAPSYDNANIVLNAVLKSKAAGTFKGSPFQKRSSILKYIATATVHGAIGTYHFDKNGDTNLRFLSVETFKGTAWSFLKAYGPKQIPNSIKSTS